MKRTSMACVLLLLLAGSSLGQDKTITLKGGDQDLTSVPVCVPLSLPKEIAKQQMAILEGPGINLIGQLTDPGLTTEHILPDEANHVRRDLHFLLPQLKAGTSLNLKYSLLAGLKGKLSKFKWDEQDDYHELVLLDANEKARPVLRYMCKKFDASTPEARNKTYKVFHHLYDPQGKRFVTNGGHTDPHTDEKKLLYPHHRGLMYAFNNITHSNGKQADTWHCPPKGNREAHVEHVKTLSQEAGTVLGRHRVLLDWYGGNDVFAKEEREMTVYALPGGTLVEFASLLKTTGGKVKLDGDPQHAGFQFRAANEVAEKTAKQTYYLRVDGPGKPGQTINWTGAQGAAQGTVNIPWKAMSFVLDDQRYSVAYLDHPKNPRDSRHSERDYGRFGCYFTYELTEDNPLLVNYRIWLQEGEMIGQQVDSLHKAFAAPPTVSAK